MTPRAYDPDAHLAHVKRLYNLYPLRTRQACIEFHGKLFAEISLKDPIDIVLDALMGSSHQILADEEIYEPKPPIAPNRYHLTEREALLNPSRIPEARSLLLGIYKTIVDSLPEAIYDTANAVYTVPLAALVKHKAEIVRAIHSAFITSTALSKTADQLRRTYYKTWGMDPNEPKGKHKPISDYTGDPLDFLRDTPFYDLFQTQVAFWPPRRAFTEHGAIFAKSGFGKSRALRAIVAHFLQEDDPPALILMDSLGSLIDGIPELEVFTTTLKDRLVILDPSQPQYMPSLNFFGLGSDDLVYYLFKAIDQSFTPRQATMISYLMEYMRHVPGADFLKLIQLLESKANPNPQIVAKLTPFAANFFQNQFWQKKTDALVTQTKSQIAQRLYTLGRIPKFAQMFAGAQPNFDPYDIMQNKKVCLINTDARSPVQGGLGEASGIFGRFVLAQCLEAARARPKDQRHLALLVVDEAKAYMDDQAALILSDARQFGLGMLLASQQPHQLPEGVRREINTNTSIRLMGNVEYSIASQYARDMFTTPDFILGMKSYDRQYAEWAAYVSNMTDRAVKLQIPFNAIEKMPKRKLTSPPPMSTKVETSLHLQTHEATSEPVALHVKMSSPPESDKPSIPDEPSTPTEGMG